jgi:hypothetical protein
MSVSNSYIATVDENLMDRCDFAQLIKVYATPRDGEQPYSPADVVEAIPVVISGGPGPKKTCPSHVERQNPHYENADEPIDSVNEWLQQEVREPPACHGASFWHYNFCQLRGSVRVTPAMPAGITDHVLDVKELLA